MKMIPVLDGRDRRSRPRRAPPAGRRTGPRATAAGAGRSPEVHRTAPERVLPARGLSGGEPAFQRCSRAREHERTPAQCEHRAAGRHGHEREVVAERHLLVDREHRGGDHAQQRSRREVGDPVGVQVAVAEPAIQPFQSAFHRRECAGPPARAPVPQALRSLRARRDSEGSVCGAVLVASAIADTERERATSARPGG